jgi:hypothetical protein
MYVFDGVINTVSSSFPVPVISYEFGWDKGSISIVTMEGGDLRGGMELYIGRNGWG